MGSVMLFLIGGFIGYMVCKLFVIEKRVSLKPTSDGGSSPDPVATKDKVNPT